MRALVAAAAAGGPALYTRAQNYEVLCVSQFTLYAKFKGNKPDFHLAMPGKDSETGEPTAPPARPHHQAKPSHLPAIMSIIGPRETHDCRELH